MSYRITQDRRLRHLVEQHQWLTLTDLNQVHRTTVMGGHVGVLDHVGQVEQRVVELRVDPGAHTPRSMHAPRTGRVGRNAGAKRPESEQNTS